VPFRVVIIESERGWRQRIDKVLYFENDTDAWAFEKKFNAKNTSLTAPYWYMQAQDPEYIRDLPAGKNYHVI